MEKLRKRSNSVSRGTSFHSSWSKRKRRLSFSRRHHYPVGIPLNVVEEGSKRSHTKKTLDGHLRAMKDLLP